MTVTDGAQHAALTRAGLDRVGLDRAGLDRAALARAVLARAEQRTGARTLPPAARSLPPGARTTAAVPERSVPERSVVERSVPERATALRTAPLTTPLTTPLSSAPGAAPGTAPDTSGSLTHPDRPPLPVSPSLAGLLPGGALRRGTSVVVTGSTSLLLAMVARASAEGSWVAVVGLPAVGLLAAQQAGVVLDRLALVPRPGPDSPTVLAALLDGVDLVVVGEGVALLDHDRRRLTARVRERGTVLLSTVPWPGAHVVLSAEPVGWTGLGSGHGHLSRHRVAVTRGGRGGAGHAARTEVVLPVPSTTGSPHTTGSPTVTGPGRRGAAPVPLRMVG